MLTETTHQVLDRSSRFNIPFSYKTTSMHDVISNMYVSTYVTHIGKISVEVQKCNNISKNVVHSTEIGIYRACINVSL